MSLLSSASGASVWRGYDYFQERKVQKLERVGDARFTGIVSGSGKNTYSTIIDLDHLRQSSCNCPHAAGRKIVCKHMVALFFTAFPDEAEKFYAEAAAYAEEEAQRQEELYDMLPKYIHKLKKAELEQILLELLYDGPDWQYDRFIRRYLDE